MGFADVSWGPPEVLKSWLSQAVTGKYSYVDPAGGGKWQGLTMNMDAYKSGESSRTPPSPFLTSWKGWVGMPALLIPLLPPSPPHLCALAHCLSSLLPSRNSESFLQLSGFFPWRISLIAPPDWVSLAGWWHWLYSISVLLPSWENVPFVPPTLLSTTILQFFWDGRRLGGP